MAHVKGVSHIAYNVTDLDRAIEFYCDVLGFRKAFDIVIPEDIDQVLPGHPMTAFKGETAMVYLEAPDGVFIELFRPLPGADPDSGGPNFEKMGYVHLSLEVDSVDDFAKELRKIGVSIDSEKSLGPDHTYTMWIKDPDGNRIELMEYTKDSWQIVNR